MIEKVRAFTEEQFNEQRNAVKIQYEEKDKSLKEEYNRHWSNELATHKYLFDRQEREVALLDELTLDEFRAHFLRMFEPATAKRLDMHWNSKSHQE